MIMNYMILKEDKREEKDNEWDCEKGWK
jgi:hypothetical protein